MSDHRCGLCKLTGRSGKFIDAHILPKALTRPSEKGRPLYQMGEGKAPVRRWSSWYDPRLVTAEGERYLTELDTWAIATLRKHKLVWSGWAGKTSLGTLETKLNDSIGIRSVAGIDRRLMRLFFLSLLWRAAASDLSEFSEVSIADEHLVELSRLIVTGDAGDLSFYPCQLTQLSTYGVIHNQTPTRALKMLPPDGEFRFSPIGIPTFRFYFDGLIAHMHIGHPLGLPVSSLGDLIVGAADTLVLSTIPYEDSRQGLEVQWIKEDYNFP